MTKIDIYSGFLGAGKTTLIKKLISEAYKGQKIVLIENEFGEIGIDGGFLQDAGIQITEMNSGCICCSLVGDFGKALTNVIEQYHPDRILIEPSGVGKLSDVIGAVKKVMNEEVTLGYTVAVVDAGKVKVYMKNFGEFYNNQVETASTIVLSRTDSIPQAKLDAAVAMLREHNDKAVIVTTPWAELTGEQLTAAMEGQSTLANELAQLVHEHEHHHHHDHDEDEDGCCCGHHHHHDDEDEDNCCCGHHHHHDDEDEDEHEHHHHHDHDHDEEEAHEHHHHEHDEHCTCGCHDHDHEHEHEHEHEHHHDHDHEHHHHDHDGHCCCGHDHDHDADEVFTSWGKETPRKYTEAELQNALTALGDPSLGTVLRAKGIVPASDGGEWLHFDYVPGAPEIRRGSADYTGRLCVIGSELDEERIASLFGVN